MILIKNIREYLTQHNLKVTPQRIAVFEAITVLRDHPNAENIIEFVRGHHPNIAVGTVYNTLETFVEHGLISRVKTDGDIMRYDAVAEKHHHLYSSDSGQINDYYDDELNKILEDYFRNKEIPDFRVEDIKVNIIGKFIKKGD